MKVQVQDVKTIGNIAKQVRKAQGLDQTTAGAFANCGITFVSQFENGKPTVQLEKALAMLDALGIDVYLDIPPELNVIDEKGAVS
ncbi:helix-turn-helix domain-containing protein [Pseudidiomarina sediminum]|uniref:helix-turn-helix domain-containing protein n=1 Tax=Pseudidiomarina sediminum TaxID=431675 RepID=UPI001C9380E5|nr:helix-turn-helix domain-containing protein [Pseudidiomarina sediminum]MBY6063725.1 helix-turn-helix domain-containing protein [Pseudidiomarina sediminum]